MLTPVDLLQSHRDKIFEQYELCLFHSSNSSKQKLNLKLNKLAVLKNTENLQLANPELAFLYKKLVEFDTALQLVKRHQHTILMQ